MYLLCKFHFTVGVHLSCLVFAFLLKIIILMYQKKPNISTYSVGCTCSYKPEYLRKNS